MNKGFTLVELIVYVALFVIILILIFQFTLSLIDSTARASAKEEVQVNAAAIIRTFGFETRHAQAVYTPTSDFVGDPGQLSLVTTRNLPPDETETYTDIYLYNGRLCVKREVTGASCRTSEKVEITSLQFTEITQPGGQESVQMLATLRYRSPRSSYYFEEIIQTSARLRNY